MATTVVQAEQIVVAEFVRRPVDLATGVLLVAAAGLGDVLVVLMLIVSAVVGSWPLFAAIVPAAWIALVVGRAGIILIRSAAGGSLVAGPDGVWIAGTPIRPGDLVFSAVTIGVPGVSPPVAWPHHPGVTPRHPFSPAFWSALPVGPLGRGLSRAEIVRLDQALMAAAGTIRWSRFVASEVGGVDPRLRDGAPPADVCEVGLAWGHRRVGLSIDVESPPRTLVLRSKPVVTPWRVAAEVSPPVGTPVMSVLIEPRRLLTAPAAVRP